MGNLKIEFEPFDGVEDVIGFRIEYKIKSSEDEYTRYDTEVTTSPIIVPEVDASRDYEGFIQCMCASGSFSTSKPFEVYPPTVFYLREYFTAGLYSFNMITGQSILKIAGFANKVGLTRSKVFMGVSAGIREYNITLDPFTYNLVRTLSWGAYSTNTFQGFFAKNDTTIITVNIPEKKVYQIDVSGSSPIFTSLFTLHRTDVDPTGGIFYNWADDTYILTFVPHTGTPGAATTVVNQYSSSGTLLMAVSYSTALTTSYGRIYSIFQYQNKIYGISHQGAVFEIKSSGFTLITITGSDIINTGIINASQLPEYCNMNIPIDASTTTAMATTTAVATTTVAATTTTPATTTA